MRTEKHKKCKLEHCKQQSNNHISLRMAFVELVLKHKHFLTSVWQRVTVITNIAVGSALRINPHTHSSLYTSKQSRTNPKQLFLLVPDPQMCVMRKQGFTAERRGKQDRHWRHASICDGVWRPSSPLSLCLLADEVRSPRGHMERCWSRNHSSLTLRKMSHTHLHQSITVHWVYLDGAAEVLSSDTPSVLLCELAVWSPCAVTLFRPRVCWVPSCFSSATCFHVLMFSVDTQSALPELFVSCFVRALGL